MSKHETYRIFHNIDDIDISEQDILDYDPDLLSTLLIDHTMTAKAQSADPSASPVNIFWATNDYYGLRLKENDTPLSDGYSYNDQITPDKITGKCRRVIMPRVLKDKQAQIVRTKDRAEVFTPSWICNAQNNLIDEAWFGHKNVFNFEILDDKGTHSWIVNENKIKFDQTDKQKSWKKYITDTRLEITCGEAPYLVSRYDTTTGERIPLGERIGLLDRKLRIVCENARSKAEWLEMARKAYMHTYGFEWQGDNLLLAREALLYTFIEYYIHYFNERDSKGSLILKDLPSNKTIKTIAEIISWNLWQMDGIKFTVPETCHQDTIIENTIFDCITTTVECEGCKTGNPLLHNGIYCKIRDWSIYEDYHRDSSGLIGKERCDKLFVNLVHKNNVKR